MDWYGESEYHDIRGGYIEVRFWQREAGWRAVAMEHCVAKSGFDLPTRYVHLREDGRVVVGV